MPSRVTQESIEAASASSADRWVGLAIVCWMVAYIVWLVTLNWDFTTDDAYISLRYARNLAEGAGLVWNPADGPLEGYSNFSFVLLGAFAESLEIDPVLTLKVAGLSGLFLTLGCLYGISRMWLTPLGSLIAPMGLVAYYGTIFWATSGLETGLFQALVALSCLCFIRGCFQPETLAYREKSYRNLLVATGLVLVLATLTRPEAPLFAAVLSAVLCWQGLKARGHRRRIVGDGLCLLIPFMGLLSIYWVWKIGYFGSILPNSFACKLGSDSASTKLTRELLEITAVPLVLALASKRSRGMAAWLLIAPTLVYLYLLYGADPIIAHFSRHGLAAFGLILVPAAIGTTTLLAWRLKFPNHTIEKGVAVVLALALLPAALRHDDRLARHATTYKLRMDARQRVGEWIEATGGPGTSFVVGDAGIISWVANEAASIDAYCLNNPTMAREEGGRDPSLFARRVLEEILPDFIVVANHHPTELNPRSGYGIYPAIVHHQRFSEYQLDKIETSYPGDGFHYFIYKRKPEAPDPLSATR